MLSRAEIQDLAARSHTLREARRRHHFPRVVPPVYPPRPVASPSQSFTSNSPAPQFLNAHSVRSGPVHRSRGGHDTPSSESDTSSDSERTSRRVRGGPVKAKGILKNGSGYRHGDSGSYGVSFQGPPSPVWSPGSAERDRMFYEPERVAKRRDYDGTVKRRDGDRLVVRKRDGERRDSGHRGHSHSGSHHGHGHRRSEREKEGKERDRENREREREKGEGKDRRRWTDNLKAAGIGGAAASLINVLTEAAEGL